MPPYLKMAIKSLPNAGAVCEKCGAKDCFARPEKVLYIRGGIVWRNGEAYDTSEYIELSGFWVVCARCLPPPRWLEFFRWAKEINEEGAAIWQNPQPLAHAA